MQGLSRATARLAALACTAAVVLFATASVASANTNPTGVAFGNGTNEGVEATQWFVNLNTSADHTYHSLDHVWVIETGNGGTWNEWVEAGAEIGAGSTGSNPQTGSGGTATYYANPTYNWADVNTGGVYYEHWWAMSNAPYSTYFTTQILHAGGGTWDVNVAGNTGTSTNNLSSMNQVAAGGETNDPTNGKVCVHDSSLQWIDTNGVAHSGLPGLSNLLPMQANWITNDTAVRGWDTNNETGSC
jgi:hypothetical protein